jgi:NADH:ubiquinone oxidoreductase subunit E
MELTKVDTIVDGYGADPASLLAIMQDVQDAAHYLPREVVEHVAKRLSVPVARIYGMATFFGSFHLEPRGKHICTVCMGTACHVRGAARLVEQLERDLKIKSGGTTADMQFTVEEVNCVGACALGPLVILDGEYHGNMTSGQLTKVVEKLRKEEGGE